MTEAEQVLHYELNDTNARRRVFAREIEDLLKDACDALEIGAPETALSRMRRAIAACVKERNI